MQRLPLIAVALAVLAQAPSAWAHESRPAYLEINEVAPGRYDVLWRTPLLSGMRLPVVLKFSDGARNVTEPTVRDLSDSLVKRRVIEAGDSQGALKEKVYDVVWSGGRKPGADGKVPRRREHGGPRHRDLDQHHRRSGVDRRDRIAADRVGIPVEHVR